MWKLIILLILIIYILNKISLFVFKVMGRPQPPPKAQHKSDGGINAEGDDNRKPKRGTGLKGGEYVDYEEVK